MCKLLTIYIILLLCSLLPGTANANNAAAGEITYTYLSDSTYRVSFKLYNDCTGNAAPDSVSLCVYNGCTGNGFTTVMYKLTGNIQNNAYANGTEVPVGCRPTKPTRCTSPSSTLPGLREWWYADTVTLPARCSNWRFRIALLARNSARNITSGNMLVETVFNNQLSLQNSSPDFSVQPTVFVCRNQPFMLDLSAADPDGDSLDFSLGWVKTSGNLNCGTTPANIGLNPLTPPVNFNNNPFQTNNSFVLDTITGQINFTTTDSGRHTFTVRVDEYRNGALIGSVLRDMQVYAFNCYTISPGPPPPVGYRKTDSIKGGVETDTFGTTVIGCVGVPLEYSYFFKQFDTATQWVLSDNADTALPGATITYTGQGTDSVRVHLSWTPGPTDTGSHTIITIITDTACRPPIGNISYIRHSSIYVPGSVSAGNDVAICAHEYIRLAPQTPGFWAGSFTWQMLPGSTGTLSCNNCDVAYGNPAPTASYLLTSSASWCPHVYTDTINVSTLSTPVTYPSVNITVWPDSNVWEWLQVDFTANTSNCTQPAYQWMKNGSDIAGATGQTYSSTTLSDKDIISCRLVCNDTCPSPRDTVSNAITIRVAVGVGETVNENTQIRTYPTPVHDYLAIDISGQPAGENYNLELMDITGSRVLSTTLPGSLNRIDVSPLPDGMYMARVLTDGRLVHVVKMVKQ